LSTASVVAFSVGTTLFLVATVLVARDAGHPMRQIPSTAIAHAVATSVVTLVTSVLLFGQARSTGRRGYEVLGATYLLVAGLMAAFPGFFPGAINPGEPLWGGIQSPISLFYAWNLVILVGVPTGAALLHHDRVTHRRPGLRVPVTAAVGLTALACLAILLSVGPGHTLLPELTRTDGITAAGSWMDAILVTLAVAGLGVTAWAARDGSDISRWLVGVMLLSFGVAAVNLNAERFSLGWYWNRGFHLVAMTALLVLIFWATARSERETARMATIDSLTGVESRAGLLASLGQELRRLGPGDALSVLWVDIDGFKDVNDQLGHVAGDKVLNHVAERLRAQAEPGDVVGRVGGDEFAVLVTGEDDLPRAVAMAGRILAAMREPFTFADVPVHLTASVGIARAPGDATGAEELLLRADLAMYAAKNVGGDRHQLFQDDLVTAALGRATLRRDLAQAIREQEFELAYQPIVRLPDLYCSGAEALVRWRRAGNLVPASRFVDFAEGSGQIVAMSREVIRLLEADVEEILGRAPADFFIDLNLSVKDLADDGLVERLASGPLGAVADRLVLEVTESLELVPGTDADRNLGRLRSAGLQVAIDDFGAGFSNFTRLEQLDPTLIKIDRSLVARAGDRNEGGVAFLAAATAVAASLRCEVVAEGIETEAEADIAALLGIEHGQGHLFGRPAPLANLLARLDAERVPAMRRPRRARASEQGREPAPPRAVGRPEDFAPRPGRPARRRSDAHRPAEHPPPPAQDGRPTD
jgi:diguanylate cyclase (GGDEF)-like protein